MDLDRSTLLELTTHVEKALQTRVKPLGFGREGRVYSVNDDIVVKIFTYTLATDPRTSEQKAYAELATLEHLYENEIKVPRPYGIFVPSSPVFTHPYLDADQIFFRSQGARDAGIFMQRINGVVPSSFTLNDLELDHANFQFEDQIKKVKKLGYRLREIALLKNSLFVRETGLLYLIDASSFVAPFA